MSIVRLRVRDGSRDDDLRLGVDHSLAAVALQKGAALFLDAALGIGEVVLGLFVGLGVGGSSHAVGGEAGGARAGVARRRVIVVEAVAQLVRLSPRLGPAGGGAPALGWVGMSRGLRLLPLGLSFEALGPRDEGLSLERLLCLTDLVEPLLAAVQLSWDIFFPHACAEALVFLGVGAFGALE